MFIRALTLSVILLKALLRTGWQTLELDDLALTQRLLANDLRVHNSSIAPRMLRTLIVRDCVISLPASKNQNPN